MIFLDTNILLYSISTNDAELIKRDISREILKNRNCVLSVQVLSEFYVQSTHNKRLDKITHEQANMLIESWMRFQIIDNSIEVFKKALIIKSKYSFSFWDSAIISAALEANCTELFSEDMQNLQKIDRLTLINPFA